MSRVFKFSESASLAIHAMLLLSENSNSILSNNQISKAIGASSNHMAKVLLSLSKHGLIKAIRGPGGGFNMQVDPDELSLFDIYICIEPDFTNTRCFFDVPKCDGQFCVMGKFTRDTVQKVADKMKKTKLNSLNVAVKFGLKGGKTDENSE